MGVDQARGHFDGYGVEGRSELFLQEQGRTGGMVEDGDHAYAVGLRGAGPGLYPLAGVGQGRVGLSHLTLG